MHRRAHSVVLQEVNPASLMRNTSLRVGWPRTGRVAPPCCTVRGHGDYGLLPARQQMAVSLGFHIVLACFGVAFPALIFAVHARGAFRGDTVALSLAKRWALIVRLQRGSGCDGTHLSPKDDWDAASSCLRADDCARIVRQGTDGAGSPPPRRSWEGISL